MSPARKPARAACAGAAGSLLGTHSHKLSQATYFRGAGDQLSIRGSCSGSA